MFFRKLPAFLALVFLWIGFTACSPQRNISPTELFPAEPSAVPTVGNLLANTGWTLVSITRAGAETPALAGRPVTLKFDGQGGASGFGGCNSYGGKYVEGNGTVQFKEVISTMMACADAPVNQQEQAYFQVLQNAAKVSLSAEQLVIISQDGQNGAKFAKGITIQPTQAQTEAAPIPAVPTAAPALPTAPQTVPTQATAAAPAVPGQASPAYLDDRSTPTGLIESYFNAVNRKEYLRAYSYWRDPAAAGGSFNKFEAGYQDTASVALTLGTIGGDVGAGQIFYSVPALLKVVKTDGRTATYTACYVLHLSQPAIQEPSFIPLGMERGQAKLVDNASDPAGLLASACSGPDFPVGQPITPAPVTNLTDVSQNNYLDNRSDPAGLISSLFNAVNRKEYARAYSYWEAQAAGGQAPAYDAFKQGYAETASVQLLTGQVTGDAGAGQFNYALPVVLTAQTTGGATQTFAGCYHLHLSNPGIQAMPPFRPLAIRSASVKGVDNNANKAELLLQACQP
jgi:heat shock protein HslJ